MKIDFLETGSFGSVSSDNIEVEIDEKFNSIAPDDKSEEKRETKKEVSYSSISSAID